ncbi:MAG: hypothetical protein IJF07_00575 [Lachnospiraceae bacterium]|nr:hypothetical protein [Lachnospiraceae bacterium]
MMKLPLQKKWLIIDILFWLAVIAAMLFVFFARLTPEYTKESLVTSYYITTEALYPGDYIVQPFSPTGNTLNGIEVAAAYEDDLPPTAQLTIQLFCGDTLLLEQPLQVISIPNCSFLPLQTNIKDCSGKDFSIVITNTSSDTTSSFALMASDIESTYLENTGVLLFNNTPCTGRLLCSFTYLTGYSYYEGLTYAFWGFLVALLLYCKRKPIVNRLNIKALMS